MRNDGLTQASQRLGKITTSSEMPIRNTERSHPQ